MTYYDLITDDDLFINGGFAEQRTSDDIIINDFLFELDENFGVDAYYWDWMNRDFAQSIKLEEIYGCGERVGVKYKITFKELVELIYNIFYDKLEDIYNGSSFSYYDAYKDYDTYQDYYDAFIDFLNNWK